MTLVKPIILLLVGLSITMHIATAVLPINGLTADGTIPSLAPMLERSKAAVVNISTKSHVRIQDNPLLNDPFFRRFFDFPEQPQAQRRTQQSLGSGVIFDAEKGLVLTNNHVIHRADEITVSLSDGRSLPAQLVGTDPATDIALIKIPAEQLTALPLADSDQLRVGDFVVAIGNPFDLGQTVTSGIVSALGRSGLGIEGYEDFIQTDASINPGNSGGALVDLRGQLVGINTAIFSPGQQRGNIGIGFAIPSNLVKQVTQQLIEYGEVRRAYLGVQMQDITPELAKAFAIDSDQGAVITQIQANSAAAEAGLQVGDIVTAINGNTLRNAASIRNTIGLLMVGERIHIDIIRAGKTRSLTAVVKEISRPQQTSTVHPKLTGATFGDIEPSSPYYGRIQGVMIYQVRRNSPAWRSGLRSKDIITSVNNKPVTDLASFKPLVHTDNAKALANKSLLLNITRNRQTLFLLLR